MKHIHCICLACACLLCRYLPAQNSTNIIDSLAGRTVKFIRAYNKQRIYLQTDRKVFAAGEKIWFKALLVNALNNRLDTASKNLFIDLVDDNDNVIKQLVLNTVAQRTNGAIQLSDSLNSGWYWLRGYTQNILRQDTSSIFLQPVYIINNKKPLPENNMPANKIAGAVNINFYPEGGNLITGLVSTGAIQVKDAADNPIIASGNIVTSKDSIITSFTTNRFGLARVSFYPKWFQQYFAVVHTGGQEIKYPLKAWDPFAAQISVTKQDRESIEASISLEDSIYTRKYVTYILGISKDSVCFAGIGRGACQVDIPVSDFPGGVATLLLFDENKHLVSERKVFIDKQNYTLDIKTDKPNYAARDKANMAIHVTDAAGRPVVASLNIAVEDDRVMNMSDVVESDSLQPVNLSLDDWLKRDRNKLTKEDIDLLMLAQPQTYTSQAIAMPDNLGTYKDTTELLVHLKGKILDRKGSPLKDRVITELATENNNTFFDVDTTGIGGDFRLNLPDAKENTLLRLQITDKRGNLQTDDKINIDTFSFPRFATPAALKKQFTLTSITAEEQVKKYHIDTVFVGVGKEWLQSVTVKTKAKKPDTYNTSKRISPFSYLITSDQISQGGYGNASNILLNVPGISFKGGYVTFFGGGLGASANSEPLVVMDGVRLPLSVLGGSGSALSDGTPQGAPVGSTSPVLEFLNSLNPADIDYMEVLRGAEAAVFGVAGGNGAIVINTRSHSFSNLNGPGALKLVTAKTYHVAPAFVMPDYSNMEIKNTKGIDPRNTIYWNGNLLTDIGGKVFVSFYTADTKTTYSVVVTGITANGDYIYKRISLARK